MKKYLPSAQVAAIYSTGTGKQDDERICTHNISQRFGKEEKSNCKLEEKVLEYITTFKEASGDYSFTADQHLKYFLILLDCESKSFHRKNVFIKCASYKEARKTRE